MVPSLWPIYDLVIRTPMLEMRLPTESEIMRLAVHADRSLYQDQGSVPFMTDWPSRPSPERERGLIQHAWGVRGGWTPDDWNLLLSPFVDGEPLGSQMLAASNFRELRQVRTGSWLGSTAQGKGIGTEMRAAVLHLAFEGLGAQQALSSARIDNISSQRVSEKLGYERAGSQLAMFGDQPAEDLRLKLTRDGWLRHRRDDIEIVGLDGCIDMFGAQAD